MARNKTKGSRSTVRAPRAGQGKGQHGGRREGAGHPTLFGEKLERRTVNLLPYEIEYLEELGRGNVSEGIRSLIRLYTAPSYPASDVER